MYIKPGVLTKGIGLELLEAILVAHDEYRKLGQSFVITSLNDGTHMKNSLHYVDKAVDLRTRELSGVTAQDMADRIKKRLGKDYDVIAEFNPPHLHIEIDKK